MDKTVGLAVCYDTKNFGSQLQVYATIKEVEKNGYIPRVIVYKKKLSKVLIKQSLPRLFNPYFTRTKLSGLAARNKYNKHKDQINNIKIRENRFENFVAKNFSNYFDIYYGWNDLVTKSSSNYKIFICGSDQLWLPGNLGSHFFTLEFANENAKKISYATSFGVKQIPWFQQKSTAKYLKRFTHLSCREFSGAEIIKKLTGIDAQVVCDPTLLLSSQDWKQYIPEKQLVSGDYIFCYLLGNKDMPREYAESIKKKTGLKIVTCPFLDEFVERDLHFGDLQEFNIDAFDFVNLIRGAKYVITDSFHGTVFSILNHKNFVVFKRFSEGVNSRNDRIFSLCHQLGLESRIYAGDDSIFTKEIDYTDVDRRLEEFKNDSQQYLEKSLND